MVPAICGGSVGVCTLLHANLRRVGRNTGNSSGGVGGSTVEYSNQGFFEQDVNIPTLVMTGALGIYYRTFWSECSQPQPAVASNPMGGASAFVLEPAPTLLAGARR